MANRASGFRARADRAVAGHGPNSMDFTERCRLEISFFRNTSVWLRSDADPDGARPDPPDSGRRREARPAPWKPWIARLVTEIGEVTAIVPEWRALAERRRGRLLCRRTGSWPGCAISASPGGRRGGGPSPRGKLRGLLRLRELQERRSWRASVCPIGDRFHPVADRADEEAVAAAAAPAIAPPGRGLRSLLLENVDAETEWWPALAKACPAPLATVERGEATLPFVKLAGLSWDDIWRAGAAAAQPAGPEAALPSQGPRRALSPHAELRRGGRRPRHPAQAADARWAERSERSRARGPTVREFHLEFAHAAVGRRWLGLTVMEVDDVPIAALYGWLIGRRWSYYRPGVDPAWSRPSPGFLLAETSREAIDDGASEYDMLQGDEAFKQRFATSSRATRTISWRPADAGRRRCSRRGSPAPGVAHSAAKPGPGRGGVAGRLGVSLLNPIRLETWTAHLAAARVRPRPRRASRGRWCGERRSREPAMR